MTTTVTRVMRNILPDFRKKIAVFLQANRCTICVQIGADRFHQSSKKQYSALDLMLWLCYDAKRNDDITNNNKKRTVR